MFPLRVKLVLPYIVCVWRKEASDWTGGVARALLVHAINCTRKLVGAFDCDDNDYSGESSQTEKANGDIPPLIGVAISIGRPAIRREMDQSFTNEECDGDGVGLTVSEIRINVGVFSKHFAC
ncbi:unnamed protein product [Taenia asiatica]|uniref:Secreted protein n=1 Tax=Taenia asiatica TaxID=60517 RepID=A0A0R3WGD6_TAEAS|nr:unnamed protein product [Taenia asiatica]